MGGYGSFFGLFFDREGGGVHLYIHVFIGIETVMGGIELL